MNLIKVAFFTLIAIIAIFLSLKIGGLSSSYAPYDHPALKVAEPWIILPLSEDREQNNKIAKLSENSPNIWIQIEVFLSKDGDFYSAPSTFLKSHHLNNLLRLTSTQIDQINSNGVITKVESLLTQFPKPFFILLIKDNEKEIDLRLQAFLKRTNSSDRILIDSEYDNVLTSLKELNPLGLYGSGIGEKTRMLMLSGLFLESAANLKGDLWVTPLYQGKAPLMNEGLRGELKRRYKPLIIGPIGDAKDLSEAQKFNPNGYILSKPELMELFH